MNGAMMNTNHTAYNFNDNLAPLTRDKFSDFLPRKRKKDAKAGHTIAWPTCNSVARKRTTLISRVSAMEINIKSEMSEAPNPKQIGIPKPNQ